jgi:transcriptional regulator with XRE-family HTH domain
MMPIEQSEKKVHQGRNIKRIREILGIKQEALAGELHLSQQAVSQQEQKEALDQEMLERVAKALKVSPEAIKNFNEKAIIHNIEDNYERANSDANNLFITNNKCTFNPLDELLKALEENKKLYERLLESEREKVEILKATRQ